MIKDTCSDPDSRFRMVQENVMQACNDPISASFGLQTDQQAPHTEAAPRPYASPQPQPQPQPQPENPNTNPNP